MYTPRSCWLSVRGIRVAMIPTCWGGRGQGGGGWGWGRWCNTSSSLKAAIAQADGVHGGGGHLGEDGEPRWPPTPSPASSHAPSRANTAPTTPCCQTAEQARATCTRSRGIMLIYAVTWHWLAVVYVHIPPWTCCNVGSQARKGWICKQMWLQANKNICMVTSDQQTLKLCKIEKATKMYTDL